MINFLKGVCFVYINIAGFVWQFYLYICQRYTLDVLTFCMYKEQHKIQFNSLTTLLLKINLNNKLNLQKKGNFSTI